MRGSAVRARRGPPFSVAVGAHRALTPQARGLRTGTGPSETPTGNFFPRSWAIPRSPGVVVQRQDIALAERRSRFKSARFHHYSLRVRWRQIQSGLISQAGGCNSHTRDHGPVVQRQDGRSARGRCRFESGRVHQSSSSNGQGTRLSIWGCGFDSRWGRQHARAQSAQAGGRLQPGQQVVRVHRACPHRRRRSGASRVRGGMATRGGRRGRGRTARRAASIPGDAPGF